MSGYCLTPQADADLDELWWHVARAGSPPAADKLGR
jgi:plasmid stabilization system protein ParE